MKTDARERSQLSEQIPESQLNATGDHILPYQYWGPGQSQWESTGSQLAIETEEQPQMPPAAWSSQRRNPTVNNHESSYSVPAKDNNPQTQAEGGQSFRRPNAHNSTETTSYVGRSHYLAHDLPIDESSARAYHGSKEPSETELKTLQLWSCCLIPPKAVRQSLIDTFMQKCYPWTPVLFPDDITNDRLGKQPSLLLNQALFLAASRVSSAPGVAAFASSEQFYQRAKVLFWLCQEKNPLAVIAATVMLQWYNPDGPEHVSFDTSRFWLQIGVGLAHQVGLHKEPTPGADYLARRRLWWSLVVSASGLLAMLVYESSSFPC